MAGCRDFNVREAQAVLDARWSVILSDMHNDARVGSSGAVEVVERPRTYAAPASKVWGQSKLHLQPPITDFLNDLAAALQRKGSRSGGSGGGHVALGGSNMSSSNLSGGSPKGGRGG